MAERAEHILTVDVEDWFHILEVDGGYGRDDWAGLESRVAANVDRLGGAPLRPFPDDGGA